MLNLRYTTGSFLNSRRASGEVPPTGNEFVKVKNIIVTIGDANTKLYVTT